MHIQLIPMFTDNYGFLVVDEASDRAAVVDPAEPGPVLAAIDRKGLELTHILCTHHHRDHAGGNAEILRRHPEATVVAGRRDAHRIPEVTRAVGDGDLIHVGELTGRVLETPGHTLGHVAFLFEDALLCGDTLFVGGCGRFFEGDAAQMHNTLNIRLANLANSTRVFCAHEYTVANLTFAHSVDPSNEALAGKLAWAIAERAIDRPTVPSTLGQERAINPFMRVSDPALQAATGETDPVAVMGRLRQLKNGFS